MEQYISKAALVAEIERKKIPFKKDIDNGVYPTYLCALMDFEDFINTIEVKEARDIWHDVSEKPELEQPLLIIMKGTHKDFRGHYRIGCYGKRANDIPTWVINGCYSDSFISKWCYISDILKQTLEVKEVNLENSIVCKVGWYDGILLGYTQEQQDELLEKIGANVGDKVRVILIKE